MHLPTHNLRIANILVSGKLAAESVNDDTTSCTEDSLDAKAASPATPASPSDNSDSALSTPRAKRYLFYKNNTVNL